MKAKDLEVNQHCVFIYKGEAGIFKAIERNPNYPEEVPVREITLDTNAGEYPRISRLVLGLRLNDEVMALKGIAHSIP
jgi:hypothetical protein